MRVRHELNAERVIEEIQEVLMGKEMIHKLEYPGRSIPQYLKFVSYGKCAESPHKENELWFVTILAIHNTHQSDFLRFPEDHTTYLVPAEYARPHIMDKWKRDTTKWESVAHKIFVGSWCPKYEMLWKDVPVFTYRLNTGEFVKYGYSRTQSKNPERELWYVAFKGRSAIVVDHIFAMPEYIERLGNDLAKWMLISFCVLDDNNEYWWDELKKGTMYSMDTF